MAKTTAADETPETAPAADQTPEATPETTPEVTPELSPKERAEARRKERQENQGNAPVSGPRDDEGRTTSLDTFDNPHEAALANLSTAVDGAGIERIIGPATLDWTPAPLEASDKEKEAADRRNRMFDKASKQRQDALANEIKEEDRGVNDPSQGGSQTSTETVAEATEKENS